MPEGYLGIWDMLSRNDIGILGMRDTPWLVHNGQPLAPADCLGRGGNAVSCGMKRSDVLADRNPTLDLTAQFPLLKPLDMSDALCRREVCRAVEGNVLIYHDSHHLSATYVRTMTPELGRQNPGCDRLVVTPGHWPARGVAARKTAGLGTERLHAIAWAARVCREAWSAARVVAPRRP